MPPPLDRPTRIGHDLQVTARTEEGIVMGLRHRVFPIEGVQFHPESFMTEHGTAMIRNFFALVQRVRLVEASAG